MKKNFILLPLLFFTFLGNGQTIDPLETAEICPHKDYSNAMAGQTNIEIFTITFPEEASNYIIDIDQNSATKPVSCKVIFNLQTDPNDSKKATCYIAFEDQRAKKPGFTIKKGATVVKTFSFSRIKSLKGLKPDIISGPAVTAPLCTTGTIIYSFSHGVRYMEIGTATEYGAVLPDYEYSVPEGWMVGNRTSTGVNDIIRSGPNALITYDELHGGEARVRASQFAQCGLVDYPASSDWATIAKITRSELKVKTNGNSSLQLSCGINSTHTFEVEGSSSAPCATFRWNLGSNANHWTYGSGDAPQIINTTTGSLTLTAKTCEGLPSGISVTVIINNKEVGTLTLPVTISYGNYSIAGADKICGFENYNIANLPCSATVVWSINEPDRAILTSAGSTARLRGKASGKVILKAELNGVCGSGPIVLTKEIRVGDVMPMITDPYDVATNLPGVPVYNKPYYIEVFPISPGYTYTWSIASPDPSDPVFLASGPRAYITFTDFGCYTVTLKQEGGCLGDETFVKQICPIEDLNGLSATVSPNPAKELLAVSLAEDIAIKGKKISNEKVTISIYGQQSGNKEKEWILDHQRQYTLNIAGLKKGIHIIRIKKGRSVTSKTIIVE